MISFNTPGRVDFEYILLTVNHLVLIIGQVIHIVIGNIFKKYFALFGELGPKSRLEFLVFTYLKLCNATIKNNKYYLLKINRLHDIAIFAKL